jgi:hypothetical protein
VCSARKVRCSVGRCSTTGFHLVAQCFLMPKPGPRKKPGERYPSGDLKPIIAPALWGRIRNFTRDRRLSSEVGRLWLHRELTDTQAAAGFLVADIYRHSDSSECAKERTAAATSAAGGEPLGAKGAKKALDDLLLEYPPKLREAVMDLCVLDRTLDWRFRDDIREVLDDIALLQLWSDPARPQDNGISKLVRGKPPGRRHQHKDDEPRPDIDPDVEAIKKVFAVFEPDMDASTKARLIDDFLALRDREEFRQEKIAAP